MPHQKGLLSFTEGPPITDLNHPIWFKEDISFDEDFENPHHLPTDYLTIAIFKEIGLSWIHLVQAMKDHQDGYTLQFQPYNVSTGLRLPETHPSITGKNLKFYSDKEDICSVGNSVVMLVVDDCILWESVRTWSKEAQKYIDECTLTIYGTFPLSTIESYKSRLGKGLQISEIIDISPLSQMDIPIRKLVKGNDFLAIHMDPI